MMIEKEGFNKSFIFLLPILSQFITYNHKYFDFIIDTYIYDENNEFQECLIIEYKFDIIKPEFKRYEEELISNVLFIKTIDVNEKVFYVFKFPERYIEDYYLFIQGLYSKISDESKTFILEFWSTIPSKFKWKEPFLIKLNRIFNKDIKLREYLEKLINIKLPENAELASTIYKEHETFNLCK